MEFTFWENEREFRFEDMEALDPVTARKQIDTNTTHGKGTEHTHTCTDTHRRKKTHFKTAKEKTRESERKKKQRRGRGEKKKTNYIEDNSQKLQ